MVSGDLCSILAELNQLPVADAGPDQTVECTSPDGTEVILDGSGSTDPNGDALTYTWVGPFGTETGESIYAYLPLGTHTITLTVEDPDGNADSDPVDITIIDSTVPSVSVSLLPNTLWSPDHKMVGITASIEVHDSCDADPSVELLSVTSNEPDDGLGDGDTANDIQGTSFGIDDREFALRAERSGIGSGRTYTATYGATDASGNAADEASAHVIVPKDAR
jgi:hypothetical protein